MATMALECWGEDWGIPSVDPECLKILAFSKFSGAPIHQKSTNNPFWTPRGDLPVFRHGADIVLTDFLSVSKHLLSCNYSADYNLSAKQVAEANAFIQLMDEKLLPAMKYLMWVDAKNHIEMTRPWYGSHLPFPLGFHYPNKYEQGAVRLVESLYGQYSDNFEDIGNDSVVETSIYKAAQECITILSNRLGESHYMFGRSPSSVDAVMYGYLAPLLKAPFPNNSLQNYLSNCSNLVKFVVRISQNYFPKVVKRHEEKTAREETASSSSSQQQSGAGGAEAEQEPPWPHETRTKVVAAGVAATAMLGYAYTSGLVDVARNIELRFGEEEEYEEEED